MEEVIGVIFDFNGTMFFDSEKHIEAWSEYVCELVGRDITDEERQLYIAGKSGKNIIEHFLGYSVSDDTYEQFVEEKESIYRRLCSEDSKKLKLAPGLEEFLDYLAEYNVPRTIASTASMSNMMYYFEVFDLYRWFDPEKIVYHSKKLRDKPFPDQYIVACRLLKKEPDRCLVFEDSVPGINSAISAGIKHIVAVTGDNPTLNIDGFDNIHAIVEDFTHLNEKLELL